MRFSTLRAPRGPFAVPARGLLLAAGLLSVALAAVNLFHERHAAQVDNLFVGVAAAVGVIWLASLVLAFRGVKPAVALAGAIAFVEFGLIASSHFVNGPAAISGFARSEGLSVVPVLMALVVSCMLTVMTSVVCWTHPTGRLRRVSLLPLLLGSIAGATLVILSATDTVRRDDFGTVSQEDGTFAAAISATLWLIGGLWIGRVRKTGALLILIGTLMALASFTSLHLVKGSHGLADISAVSGPAWAVVATAMAGLAAASLLVALAILAASLIRSVRKARPVRTIAVKPPA